MNKKTLIRSTFIILMTMLMQAINVFASDMFKNGHLYESVTSNLQPQHTLALAHKMMGHINLAKFALDIKLPRHAIHHIEKAQVINTQLASRLPELILYSVFNYGKVTYAGNHKFVEYYVPVLNDVLLISDFDGVSEQTKELGLKGSNAGLVRVCMEMDLYETEEALDTVLSHIGRKEYSQAKILLDTLFKNAFIDEAEIDSPILSITENLALAKAFINNRQFNNTHLAFVYIQKRLNSTISVNFSPAELDHLKKLSITFNELQAELRKKDPATAQSIQDRVEQLRQTFRRWFG